MKKFLILFICLSCLTGISSHAQVEKNALKTTFLSVYTGSIKLAYERAIRSNQTVEATVGVIGWAHDSFRNNPTGTLFHYAHKFIFSFDENHPLHGSYLKPLLAISSFQYDNKDSLERSRSTKGALMACFGYQWAKSSFVTDIYAGIGGALGSSCDTNYEHGFMLWDFRNSIHENLAVTFGVKMGMSF